MVQGLKNLWLAIRLFWKFKKFLWFVLCDYEKITRLTDELSEDHQRGVERAINAQVTVSSLLELRSVVEFVKTTDTVADDKALETLKKAVKDTKVFQAAWKIIHGVWNIRVEQSRWSKFVEGIRESLPFVDKTKAVKSLAVVPEDAPLLTEKEELHVINVVSLIVLILNVVIRVIELIRKSRKD